MAHPPELQGVGMSDQTSAQILTAAMAALDVKGVKWPCRNRPEWTSDNTAEQELAAAACGPCPHDLKTYTKPRKAVA
jgi:hypothetical protein